MKVKLFYHSILSDWNHGNAHFLRGLVKELQARGISAEVWEEENNWSLQNLRKEKGDAYLEQLQRQYPEWKPNFYHPEKTNLAEIVREADLVLVHEWNAPALVSQMGKLKEQYGFQLLFHDTHHRSITASKEMARYDLSVYDGVIAFGEIVRDIYLQNGWTQQAWTMHEAADTRLFRPHPEKKKIGDLVWIGNWGDNERTEELIEYLIKPVQELGLRATMHGVRYPEKAIKMLEKAGIHYGGYLPSHLVPEVLAQYRMTVHVPRRPYVEALPGIPTIRPFEALSCGIPLISSFWEDSENLFRVGQDFLMVKDGTEMREAMQEVLGNEELREQMIARGIQTIQQRHSCRHRADELIAIYQELLVRNGKITQSL
ncbi:MAG: glycosyltransferase [Cyclobacteriaceae bacterium]